MTHDKDKHPYIPPLLEVFTYMVENGYGESAKGETYSDNWSEWNDRSGGGYDGENQTGSWNYGGEWF